MVIKDPESQALEIFVYDWEQVGKHEKMAMNVEDPKIMTLDLLKNMDPYDVQNNKSRGKIMMELIYKPFKEEDKINGAESGTIEKAPEGTPPGGGVFAVLIHEAEDVEGKHHTNPYVRIIFKGEEKKN